MLIRRPPPRRQAPAATAEARSASLAYPADPGQREARLEAEQRVRDRERERGRQPDQDRNPKGGPPYKRAFGEPEAKAQSNFTDPESAIMKTSGEGFQQCYNAQVVVDGKNQMIVAKAVDRSATDQGQLLPMPDAAAATALSMGHC